MICDNCSSKEFYIKNHKHSYTFKGKTIEFESKRRFCRKCNNLVYDKELDEEAIRKALALYNSKYGIPKEKIIELRKKLNLSQDMFAKIIGCAKKTLISYEKGTAIPNENYVIIINSLLEKPNIIDVLIESNKYNFKEKEYNKIKTRILEFIAENSYSFDDDVEDKLTEYNGYTSFNLKKAINMILYFAKEGILKTKLMKEMFYADFINFRETGASITGLKYAKITYGPVPDNKDQILLKCLNEKYIELDIKYNNDFEQHIIKSLKEFDKYLFDDYELKSLEKVKNYFLNYKAKQIADFSHEEKGYIDTDFSKYISYDYAFDIDRL